MDFSKINPDFPVDFEQVLELIQLNLDFTLNLG